MKSDAAFIVNRPQDIGMAVVDDVLDMREDNIQIENKDKSNNTESAFFFPGATRFPGRAPGKPKTLSRELRPGPHTKVISHG